ncbi:peptidylprolyl isomerase [Spirochaetia bacterium 38H-sp]|uniref:Peptidyl-prolyl cis-trans isomerase n=1 Tax=Rarispira pelagica TaxID=3141764 RepID=A0ABU9UCU5_9SPIR
MRHIFLYILIIISILTSCVSNKETADNKPDINQETVKKGLLVQLSYTGMLTNSTQFAASPPDAPLIFIIGSGMIIKGLEEGIIGMHVGETRTIIVPPEKGYGLWDKNAVQRFYYEDLGLSDSSTVEIGDIIGVDTQQGIIPATVIEKNKDTIVVDLNHPLAGKTLIFKVTILAIREPTEQEKKLYSTFTSGN